MVPGYSSIGHCANNSPETLSSILMKSFVPRETTLSLPVKSGASSFQSDARYPRFEGRGGILYTNTGERKEGRERKERREREEEKGRKSKGGRVREEV